MQAGHLMSTSSRGLQLRMHSVLGCGADCASALLLRPAVPAVRLNLTYGGDCGQDAQASAWLWRRLPGWLQHAAALRTALPQHRSPWKRGGWYQLAASAHHHVTRRVCRFGLLSGGG
jgi:hypothetical protein